MYLQKPNTAGLECGTFSAVFLQVKELWGILAYTHYRSNKANVSVGKFSITKVNKK
jgi:hypothetical protein